MSSALPPDPSDKNEEQSSGPNLVLIYSLIALGFLIAIGCAALIVLPFYSHRH